ncbi:MAG: phosphorylase [Hyphomicrobium sp.]|uniref:phosphorylase family protein n=1 Tax=Hyphomicrobium sp. TaxID=82 RepID=UPI0039E5CA63
MVSGFVIAATGLKAEARIAERSPGVKAVIGGAREDHLASVLTQSIGDGVTGLISFGIAGGLRPGLKPGTIVIGTSVVHSSGRIYSSDARWSDRLFEALPNAETGPVAGSSTIIANQVEKRAIYLSSGAFAADMESHVVAQVATDRGLPFAVLRAVADPATLSLPPAAVNGLNPDGSPNISAVLKSLATQPGQLWDIVRIAGATRRAMKSLLRCHRLLGPGLGGADLG